MSSERSPGPLPDLHAVRGPEIDRARQERKIKLMEDIFEAEYRAWMKLSRIEKFVNLDVRPELARWTNEIGDELNQLLEMLRRTGGITDKDWDDYIYFRDEGHWPDGSDLQ